jgi:hypothetical protein
MGRAGGKASVRSRLGLDVDADDSLREKARQRLHSMLDCENPQLALRAAQSLFSYSSAKPPAEVQQDWQPLGGKPFSAKAVLKILQDAGAFDGYEAPGFAELETALEERLQPLPPQQVASLAGVIETAAEIDCIRGNPELAQAVRRAYATLDDVDPEIKRAAEKFTEKVANLAARSREDDEPAPAIAEAPPSENGKPKPPTPRPTRATPQPTNQRPGPPWWEDEEGREQRALATRALRYEEA